MKTKIVVAIFAIASVCISCKGNGNNPSNDPAKGTSTPELIEKFLGKTTSEADKIITNAGWVLFDEDKESREYIPAGDKIQRKTDDEFVVDEDVKNYLSLDIVDGIIAGAYFYSFFEEMPELRKLTREVVNWAYSNVLKGKSIEDSYVTLTYEESELTNLKHDDFVNKLSAEDWIFACESYDFEEGGGYSIYSGEARKKVQENPPVPVSPNEVAKQQNDDYEISRAFLYERYLNSVDWK